MSTSNGVLTEAETLQLLTRAIEGSPDGLMAEGTWFGLANGLPRLRSIQRCLKWS